MNNKQWTYDDLRVLCTALAEGYDYAELAKMFDRSESAIKNQRHRFITKNVKGKFGKKLYATSEYKNFMDDYKNEPVVLPEKVKPTVETKVVKYVDNSVEDFASIKKSVEKEYFNLQLITAGIFTILGFIVGKFI